jgi:hypothetical protein
MIDWYYGAGKLRRGGVVVIDDLQLPAVEVLDRFLTLDPRWNEISRSPEWVAFERQSEGPVAEDWVMQSFYRLASTRQVLKERVLAGLQNRVDQAKRQLSRR